ncbi:MAG: SusD/RagB family nutrient-binding outer membrane lipoprotein [Chitinophagaceae bacterium]
MKANLFKYILGGAVLVGSLGSCKKITDINYTPNKPSQPQTALLITSAERSVAGLVNATQPRLYVQQISNVFYTDESRYKAIQFDYNAIYNGPLEDLNLVILLNTADSTKTAPYVVSGGSNANQIAAARILKAFFFFNMTDRFGDIPYSEALKGVSELTPKFDAQKDVYTALFSELTAAVAQFDGGSLNGDILFSGNVAAWKRFANTIKLMAALHLSKKDPATGKAKFNEALAAGVISSNTENISYKFLAESANENNIYNNYQVAKRYDYAISKPMVDMLTTLSDPRLAVYATPTATNTIVGMPYGLLQGAPGYSAGTVDNLPTSAGNISLIGAKFRQQNSAVSIYTYSEVLFSVAEAYKLGWITGSADDVNAAAKYTAAVTASFNEQGITDAVAISNYIGQAGVVYNSANAIKLILTQKWIASYMGYGYEAWTDWRRTGYPELTVTPNAYTTPKIIPRRQGYPLTERDLNTDNYNAVVASQGADDLTTSVWWDKP